jgi:hypothetical protein
VRRHRAGQPDVGGEVRGDHCVDLRIGELLRGADEPIARVGDHDIDPAEVGERLADDAAHRVGIGDVERAYP